MIDLPIEMLELILSNVNNNLTIKNCRLACKYFKNYFTPLNVYSKHGDLLETVTFEENLVKSVFPNGKIKREQIIGYLGNTLYKEYNIFGTLVKKIIFNPPSYIKKETISMNNIEVVNYNIKDCKEIKYNIMLGIQCSIS